MTGAAALLPEPRVATRRNLGQAVLRRSFRLRVSGVDRVPPWGPLLLVANHPSVADALVLAAAAPRPVHVVETDAAAVGPLLGAVTGMGGLVADGPADRAVLAAAVEALDDHRAVAVFPEVEVGDGSASRTADAAGYLLARRAVPVVPVAVLGTRTGDAPRQAAPRWRAPVVVAFGPVLDLGPAPASPTRADAARLAETVRQHLHDHVAETVRRTGVALPGLPEETR